MSTDMVLPSPKPSHLVALTPADVPAQQAQLLAYCDQQIRELSEERSDLLDNARVAKANNWAFASLEAQARKRTQRIEYFQRIRAAVEEGYLVVPNFEGLVLAVRTNKRTSPSTISTNVREVNQAHPSLSPVGQGRYVRQEIPAQVFDRETDKTTGRETVHWQGLDFNETLAFPGTLVKPIVMDATARAMSKKIFDRIVVAGVGGTRAQQRRNPNTDPFVLGQIVDPRQRGSFWREPKVVSFFIAWWLDSEDAVTTPECSTRTCSTCHAAPPREGQRTCHACHAAWMRAHRPIYASLIRRARLSAPPPVPGKAE